jgi:hypothetical protein
MRAAGWGGLSTTSSGKGKQRANEPAGHMRIGMISNAAKFQADRSRGRGVAGVHARAETRRGKGKTRERKNEEKAFFAQHGGLIETRAALPPPPLLPFHLLFEFDCFSLLCGLSLHSSVSEGMIITAHASSLTPTPQSSFLLLTAPSSRGLLRALILKSMR